MIDIRFLIFKIAATSVLLLVSYVLMIANSDCNKANCVGVTMCLLWTIPLIFSLFMIVVVWSIKKRDELPKQHTRRTLNTNTQSVKHSGSSSNKKKETKK